MNPTLVTPKRDVVTEPSPAAPAGAALVQHDTARFGPVSIAADSVIEFPVGLIGLRGSHYALLCTDTNSPFLWLQSLDDPGLALPVTNPHRFFSDFSVELDEEDSEQIGVDERDVVDVLVTVTIAAGGVTANLKAPILVHGGVAHQVINRVSSAQVKTPLLSFAQRAGS